MAQWQARESVEEARERLRQQAVASVQEAQQRVRAKASESIAEARARIAAEDAAVLAKVSRLALLRLMVHLLGFSCQGVNGTCFSSCAPSLCLSVGVQRTTMN